MSRYKIAYFSEFILFPPFVIVLAIVALNGAGARAIATWIVYVVTGVVLWTLIEYLLHRFVFHHAPYISDIHERHHDNPSALIGAPVWSSVTLALLAVLFPLWMLLGFSMAAGLTTGITAGYLWYVMLHYASHHWQPRYGSYLYRVRIRHALHHYTDESGNFGVSVDFWDRLFGTTLTPRRKRTLSSDAVGQN